jgi:hypothetical protein
MLSIALVVNQAQAEIVTYEFTGTFTDDGDTSITEIDDENDVFGGLAVGDSWKVELGVQLDTTGTPDDFDPEIWWYDEAVKSATIVFSGASGVKYSKTYSEGDFESYHNISVANFEDFDYVGSDIELAPGNTGVLRLTILNDMDLGSIGDQTELPGIGTEIAQESMLLEQVMHYELPQSDELPNGALVKFFSEDIGHFRVVPEPSAITLWCLAAAGLGGVMWRRRRAA